jgi:hypothetical protein
MLAMNTRFVNYGMQETQNTSGSDEQPWRDVCAADETYVSILQSSIGVEPSVVRPVSR